MVVIDGVSKTITKMANYDTYQHDSATLEHDLLMLRDGDIVILVSHDEPATKLSSTARLLLHELGSGKSQNIFYRSSYYFVSQKSIQGYTPFEGLSLPVSGGWGPALKFEACIPYQIDGIPVQVDETIDENDDRRKFCDIYGDTWELFCEPSVVNDPLIIAMAPKSQPLSAAIEKTPLVVFTQGLSRILPLTLETIIRQPGINPKNVIVFYNETVSSLMTPLLDLFGFMAESYEDNDKINSAIETVKLLFPDSEQFILIENDVILSPDFLSFMSQLTRALQYPGSDLIGISAFNEDSRSDQAGNEATIMRTDSSKARPRMAAMFKSNATVKFSGAKWSFSDDAISGAILIPQVSRVLYLPQASPEPLSDSESTFLSAYLHADSSVAQSDSVLLQVTDQLVCAAK
ncbi:Protein FAM3A [Halotydeus destructor]|nr:Protein FAM3A [Halotydeus destructor]